MILHFLEIVDSFHRKRSPSLEEGGFHYKIDILTHLSEIRINLIIGKSYNL